MPYKINEWTCSNYTKVLVRKYEPGPWPGDRQASPQMRSQRTPGAYSRWSPSEGALPLPSAQWLWLPNRKCARIPIKQNFDFHHFDDVTLCPYTIYYSESELWLPERIRQTCAQWPVARWALWAAAPRAAEWIRPVGPPRPETTALYLWNGKHK